MFKKNGFTCITTDVLMFESYFFTYTMYREGDFIYFFLLGIHFALLRGGGWVLLLRLNYLLDN